MKLRDYQVDIANQAFKILPDKKIVYISAEVRTGKSLMALETAKLFGAERVLFLTKKKAISSIEDDYRDFGYTFNLTVINDESMHKIEGQFDLVIHDEHHRFGAFPKPGTNTKQFKSLYGHLPMIFLSGTMSPESYSQIYHQFWVSKFSPFRQYTNFYKWANDFVNIKLRNLGYAQVKDYSEANYDKIYPIIKPYIITFTQEQSGFTTQVIEHIIPVYMQPVTYNVINRLKRDLVVTASDGRVILADTGVKLQQKVHQLGSGTIKFEDGTSKIIDYSKANVIKERFSDYKIGIFYKYKEEFNMLKEVFGDKITTELDEFNQSDKWIAYQYLSGREGINLSKADYLVMFSIDFSATTYFQARARMAVKDREKNEIFWLFAKNTLDDKIYRTVIKKKNYTSTLFKKHVSNVRTSTTKENNEPTTARRMASRKID
jgi:hypothetical protein